MKIPFVDLKVQYSNIKSEVDAAIEDILINTSFIGGEKVRQFERSFAAYIGVNHCVSCANGTDALEIALQSLGIGDGDEVIVPAMSWIATSEAVTTVGALPIFADILPRDWTIDLGDIQRKITPKTKAIIPVHLYGRAANMMEIMRIASVHGLKVVEDCAQAPGATHKGKNLGSYGDIATFSFYPGKNLGAYGDAGAIVTNDKMCADTCRMISNHGQIEKHNHRIEGRNSRLDTLQAAVLSVKLNHIEQWTERRIDLAKYYNERLADLQIETPRISKFHRHVFHVYVIQVPNRDKVKEKLAQRGVATQVHYPKALPELIPYRSKFEVNNFPKSKHLAHSGLSLPLYSEMTSTQVDTVVCQLREVLSEIN